jgi:hypothetical protein
MTIPSGQSAGTFGSALAIATRSASVLTGLAHDGGFLLGSHRSERHLFSRARAADAQAAQS